MKKTLLVGLVWVIPSISFGIAVEDCNVHFIAKTHGEIVSKYYERFRNQQATAEDVQRASEQAANVSGMALTDMLLACNEIEKLRIALLEDGLQAESQTKLPARSLLEQSIKRYVEAANSGDEMWLKASMTSYAYHKLKDNYAKAGIDLTSDEITNMVSSVPDITVAKFDQIFSEGATAGIVYQQEGEKEADGVERVKFMFFKLVKESAEWLYSGGAIFYSPKYQDDGTESKFNLSDLELLGKSDLLVDGVVHKRTTQSAGAGLSLFVTIQSFGYDTKVFIDGELQASASGSQSAKRVVLSVGNHTLKIKLSRTDQQVVDVPTVSLEAVNDDGSYSEVFVSEFSADAIGEYEFPVSVGK